MNDFLDTRKINNTDCRNYTACKCMSTMYESQQEWGITRWYFVYVRCEV